MTLAIELFFVLTSLLLAGAALKGSSRAWRLESHPIDFAMQILASIWLVYLLICVAQTLVPGHAAVALPALVLVKDVVYAGLIGSLAFFLLTSAGAVRSSVLFVLALQVTGGLVAAVWQAFAAEALPVAQWVWWALSLITAAAVTASITRQTRHTHSRRSWLALAACAVGLGVWLYQAGLQGSANSALPAVFHLYAFFVFVTWKLVSLNPDADRAIANAGTSVSGKSSFQTLASVSSNDEFVSLALRAERQRISYELHDNVGSQIVSILFTMQAAEQPQKRYVMLSLEQCLTDLKMMVDALDSFEENVTQALGRLRYRVQHALDRQAIKMEWDVDISDELEAVQGIYAQQVLRIAQESVANVMRHSKAGSVKVSCRFVPEFCHLLLEVRDDGTGIALIDGKRPSGRGLEGMKRRATIVGGHLHISTRSKEGTCVRLTLPLPYLKKRAGSVGVETANTQAAM